MGASLQGFRRHPFVAVETLSFLITGSVLSSRLGTWDPRYFTPMLILALPLVLRVALVIPTPRPIVIEHPGVLRWPYCVLAVLAGSAIALPSVPPLFGAELGYPWGHAAADLLWALEPPALLVLAVGCFAVAIFATMKLKKIFFSDQWKSVLLSRALLVSVSALLLPLAAAVGTASALLLIASPRGAFTTADWFFRSIYAVEAAVAAFLILAVFPIAITVSLYRGTRLLVYGESFDGESHG